MCGKQCCSICFWYFCLFNTFSLREGSAPHARVVGAQLRGAAEVMQSVVRHVQQLVCLRPFPHSPNADNYHSYTLIQALQQNMQDQAHRMRHRKWHFQVGGRDEEKGRGPVPSRTRPGSPAGSAPPPSCTPLRGRRQSSICPQHRRFLDTTSAAHFRVTTCTFISRQQRSAFAVTARGCAYRWRRGGSSSPHTRGP